MPSNPRSVIQVSRRRVLQAGFLGGVGLSLADYLRLAHSASSRPLADAAVFIHLQGGPSHLDTLDMKPAAPAEERGPFKRIQTSLPGLVACEHLPRLAKAIDRFTLLRGISHSAGAHPQANQYLFTGNRVSPAVEHPALGAVVSKELAAPPDVPSFVAVPGSEMRPGYLGVAYAPFSTSVTPQAGEPFEVRGLVLGEGLSIDRVRNREALLADLDQTFRQGDAHSDLLEGMDQFARKAQQMILSPRSREAFDISREPPSITSLFGDDELSQSALLAVRLVEYGVRFVTVTHGGWDTHLDNFQRLEKPLLPQLDRALPALVESLALKGLLERTLVVVTGEFGRTPAINKNAGRDHWPRTMWTLLAGGGTPPGQLIGLTDDKGHGPDDGTDIKPDDLAASIYHALGINAKHEYYTATGRPVTLVPEGRLIPGLFGSA